MKVTYLQHSGFWVELQTANILFDYYKGTLPKFDKKKKLYIFASHRHYDHYKRSIFDLKEKYPNITYILSDDIPRKNYNLDAVFCGPNMRYETEDIAVSTLRSTDEGVAFLVYCEGKIIYHAGDLNWWYWEEEGRVYNEMTRRNYQYEMSKLRDVPIDVAFVPLDSRQVEGFGKGFRMFLEETTAKYVFPMHSWGDYSVTKRFLAMEGKEAYRDRIMEITDEPQVFEIEEAAVNVPEEQDETLKPEGGEEEKV